MIAPLPMSQALAVILLVLALSALAMYDGAHEYLRIWAGYVALRVVYRIVTEGWFGGP